MDEINGNLQKGKHRCIKFVVHGVISTSLDNIRIQIAYYIKSYTPDYDVDKMVFTSRELDWFYNIRNAYDYDFDSNGFCSVNLKKYDDVMKEYRMKLKGNFILLKLGFNRRIGNMSKTPISIDSTLSYEMAEHVPNETIVDVYWFTKRLFYFLAYRRNIEFSEITLMKKRLEDGKFEAIGILKVIDDDNSSSFTENEKTIRDQLIKIDLIDDSFEKLLDAVASERIYIEHIPYNSRDKKSITPARFILVMAAFEWEFKDIFGDVKYATNKPYRDTKDIVINILNVLLEKSTGKHKSYFRSTLKGVMNAGVSLSEKIMYVMKQYEELLTPFISNLYSFNDSDEFCINDMAIRLQTQRNNYAHGNIDKEFDDLVILDFIIFEWLLYAMRLKSIGVSDDVTKKMINELFSRRIALGS